MHKIEINGAVFLAEDETRLSNILLQRGYRIEQPCGGKGTCKKCVVTVNGKEELACQYKIKSDISVSLPDYGKIISETGANETGRQTKNLCYALDIGTTTLALALVSLDENRIIKVVTSTNPQRTFGADVMTRIDYCSKNGVDALYNAIISEINTMIAEFDVHSIEKLYVAGNATMLHLFFGVDCASIGVAPYTPVFLKSRTEKAENLGLQGVETVEALPSVASFVGADLVAGLNFVGMPEKGRYNLLVDLGTNAEIVLFSETAAICTAAAAGPCFEGANISCGMSATNGAIYAYSKHELKTVGDAPVKGICGTGLVDIIAELVDDGTIDETGYMECENFEIANKVYIDQSDIRQFQLAKSAVYSAIITLLQRENVSFDGIEKVYISGGFSARINIENASKTGLFPHELAKKCVVINNSSLLGTVKYACEKNDLCAYTENTVYVDLSADHAFSNLFVENMMFA